MKINCADGDSIYYTSGGAKPHFSLRVTNAVEKCRIIAALGEDFSCRAETRVAAAATNGAKPIAETKIRAPARRGT
jgi:hypothetical protein